MITGKHLLLQTIAATQQRKHWPSWHRKNLRPSHCSKWCLFILYSTIEQSTQQSCKQNILIFSMLGFKDLNKCTTSVICFFLEECLQELKNTPCFFNLYWGTFVKETFKKKSFIEYWPKYHLKNNSGNKMALSIVSPKVDLYSIKNYGKSNLPSLVAALKKHGTLLNQQWKSGWW